MKKPEIVKGEYIPRKRDYQSNSNKIKESSSKDVGELLNKLDGNQLQLIATDLIGCIASVTSNVLDYAKESEKTKQVHTQCHAEIKKIEAQVAQVREEEKTKREQISADRANNSEKHIYEMNKERNTHEVIMQILKQVEDGAISSELLVDVIRNVKQ